MTKFKKLLVLCLALVLTVVSFPMGAYATDAETDTDIYVGKGQLNVQHYNVSNIPAFDVVTGLTTPQHHALWTAIDMNEALTSEELAKPATHTNNNWADTGSVFLNKISGTQKIAYQASGFMKLDGVTSIQVLSDDGIKLTVGPKSDSDWEMQTEGVATLTFDQAMTGDYPIALSYMNWGGQGKLILQTKKVVMALGKQLQAICFIFLEHLECLKLLTLN